MNTTTAITGAALTALATLSGCETAPRAAERPALITHIVLVDLTNDAERAEMLADADEKLATIPGVVAYAAGTHFDSGMGTVMDDYDAALVLGFGSAEDLRAYDAHPNHKAFVDRWSPRVETLHVRDMIDRDE